MLANFQPLHLMTQPPAKLKENLGTEWWNTMKAYVDMTISYAFPDLKHFNNDTFFQCEALLEALVSIIAAKNLENLPAPMKESLSDIISFLSAEDDSNNVYQALLNREVNKPELQLVKEAMRYALSLNIEVAFLHAIANNNLEELNSLRDKEKDTLSEYYDLFLHFASKKDNTEVVNLLQGNSQQVASDKQPAVKNTTTVPQYVGMAAAPKSVSDGEFTSLLSEKALKDNPDVIRLNIEMSSTQVDILCQHLKKSSFTSIHLQYCQLSHDSLQKILSAVPKSLVFLDISGNKIGDQGAKALSEFLKAAEDKGWNITVYLSQNNITKKGGEFLNIHDVRGLDEQASISQEDVRAKTEKLEQDRKKHHADAVRRAKEMADRLKREKEEDLKRRIQEETDAKLAAEIQREDQEEAKVGYEEGRDKYFAERHKEFRDAIKDKNIKDRFPNAIRFFSGNLENIFKLLDIYQEFKGHTDDQKKQLNVFFGKEDMDVHIDNVLQILGSLIGLAGEFNAYITNEKVQDLSQLSEQEYGDLKSKINNFSTAWENLQNADQRISDITLNARILEIEGFIDKMKSEKTGAVHDVPLHQELRHQIPPSSTAPVKKKPDEIEEERPIREQEGAEDLRAQPIPVSVQPKDMLKNEKLGSTPLVNASQEINLDNSTSPVGASTLSKKEKIQRIMLGGSIGALVLGGGSLAISIVMGVTLGVTGLALIALGPVGWVIGGVAIAGFIGGALVAKQTYSTIPLESTTQRPEEATKPSSEEDKKEIQNNLSTSTQTVFAAQKLSPSSGLASGQEIMHNH